MAMSRRMRFVIAAVVSAVTWFVVLLYTLGTKWYALGVNDNWIEMHLPPHLVILATLLAVAVSYFAWRWYRTDRVQQAMSALNDDERRELLTRLTARDDAAGEGDSLYDLVLTPRKRKLAGEQDAE